MKMSPVLGNKTLTYSVTIATRAISPRFQSFTNKTRKDLFKVCQTFCLSEQKAPQAVQTCQTCRFRDLVVN